MKQYLIVVDIQNDFVDGALGTPEAVSIIPMAENKIRNFEGRIFVTYDTHFDNYIDTAEGKKLPVAHCIKETVGWMLNDKIAVALVGKEFVSVEKHTFGSVDLPGLIEADAAGENFEISIIGLCTDICVVSNALILKANFPEKKIAVDASCCAGVSPASHKAALETMKMCQIDVINE